MNNYFFRNREGKNSPATYLGTFFLLITGIIGFGNIPLYAALFSKGFSPEEIDKIDLSHIDEILGKNLYLTIQLFPMIIGFLMLLFAIKFIHKSPVKHYFTARSEFDFKRFFTAFGIALVLLLSLFAVQYFTIGETLVYNLDLPKFTTLLTICIFLLPIQTGFEELLFRGYLLQAFGRSELRGVAVLIINGLLFGLLHLANPEVFHLGYGVMVFYVVSGIFAALIALMDDGIELSWGFHTANNMIPLLLVSNNWQALQTDAVFIDTSKPAIGAEIFITLLIFYPLMLLIFSRIYRWKNWRERLL